MNLKGRRAENQAIKFLSLHGYTILATNYRSSYGEIDIIAQDGETLCFVEVKSRESNGMYSPADAVTVKKQKKIIYSAQCYLKDHYKQEPACRFDVVSILSNQEPEIIRDAFQLDR